MMGPFEATKSCLSRYFQFSGRATRSEFWWFCFVTVILVFGSKALALTALSNLLWLAMLIPWLAVTWRRLHDSDLAGSWIFLPAVLCIEGVYDTPFSDFFSITPRIEENVSEAQINESMTIGELMALPLPDPAFVQENFANAFKFPFVLPIVFAVGLTLFLTLRASTPGPNRFGPQPGKESYINPPPSKPSQPHT